MYFLQGPKLYEGTVENSQSALLINKKKSELAAVVNRHLKYN